MKIIKTHWMTRREWVSKHDPGSVGAAFCAGVEGGRRMTPKEAMDFVSRIANEYDRIEREKHGWTWVVDRKLLDVFSEIMLALGRNTRKPVSEGKVAGQSVTFCPTCRITVPREVRGLKTRYCPYCGQAIEWGTRKGEEHGN